MKKTFLIFFVSLALLLLFSGTAKAVSCVGGHPELFPDPSPGQAPAIVQCGQFPDCPCDLGDFFLTLLRIYNFAVYFIALPLATLMVIIGGVLILISGGNPNRAATGKNILKFAIIGLVLAFGSWLIIDVVLKAIGYMGNWTTF